MGGKHQRIHGLKIQCGGKDQRSEYRPSAQQQAIQLKLVKLKSHFII